jgi:hypothetical protein
MSLNITSVGKWHKGRSGNPGGAPKRYQGPTLAELCKAQTADAVKTLITMMRFKGPNQLPATLAILDRGWGRPAQRIETDGVDSVHLHLLAALQIQPQLEQPREGEPARTPMLIEGDVPTE